MARPKGTEETHPLHTRLTGAQLAGFNEYKRLQQEQIKHTGVQLTDAAVLRGMVLRSLDAEGIPHTTQQPLLFGASTPNEASVVEPEPTAAASKKPAARKKPTPKKSAPKKPTPKKSAPKKQPAKR